jgi:NAD(P)H-dependent flavin oxidoreductase YrpB (nitropropane dioxygenase family)
MLSFGGPRPLAAPVRASGAALIIQVTSLDEARQALDLGADVIVAQGTEAGGHGARHGWSTLAFVPVVADLAAPVPVLAASPQARSDYQRGVASGELPPRPVWASQAIDLITDLPPAAEVIASLAARAEEALARALAR